MKLIVDEVFKQFDSKKVLKGATFTFEEGKIYGLLGRNGAGKTTLFNIISKDNFIGFQEIFICLMVIEKNLMRKIWVMLFQLQMYQHF